jgi:hypothetical protein
VGGTNPSLLRAIGAGAAVLAWDVVFNREVLRDAGQYFGDPQEVARLVDRAEADPEGLRTLGRRARERARAYDWDLVTDGYEQLALRLAHRDVPARRPTGRRLVGTADVVPLRPRIVKPRAVPAPEVVVARPVGERPLLSGGGQQ